MTKATSISRNKQVANYAKTRFYTTGTTPAIRKFPVVLSESHHLGEVEFEEKTLASTAMTNLKESYQPLNGFPDVYTRFSPIPADSDDIGALPSNSEIKVSITKDFDVIGAIKFRALREQVQAVEERHNAEIKELRVDVKDRDIDISKLQVDVASLKSRAYRIDVRNVLDCIRDDMVGKPWQKFMTKQRRKDPKKAITKFLNASKDNRWKALWSNPAFQDLIVSPPSLPTGEDKDLLLKSSRILNL